MRKLKTAVFISGRGNNMVALAKAAQQHDYPLSIDLVISDNILAFGNDRAQEMDIPCFVCVDKKKSIFEQKCQDILDQYNIEFICLAGFMRLVSPSFVNRWAPNLINIHPSLLPKYPGLDTHRRAIEHGERMAGCTVHYVDQGMDTGPVIDQIQVPVYKSDTPDTLGKRVMEQELVLYPRAAKIAAHKILGIV